LFKVRDPLALKLATLNNIEFYLDLMKNIRKAIADDNL
jgi:tRNA-guanine family transglycosylase